MRLRRARRGRIDTGASSEPEQSRALQRERPVSQRRRGEFVGIGGEELAARAILPPEAKVAADALVAGAVLQQPAHEHLRGEAVVGAGPVQSRRELAGRQIDEIQGYRRVEPRAIAIRAVIKPTPIARSVAATPGNFVRA